MPVTWPDKAGDWFGCLDVTGQLWVHTDRDFLLRQVSGRNSLIRNTYFAVARRVPRGTPGRIAGEGELPPRGRP